MTVHLEPPDILALASNLLSAIIQTPCLPSPPEPQNLRLAVSALTNHKLDDASLDAVTHVITVTLRRATFNPSPEGPDAPERSDH